MGASNREETLSRKVVRPDSCWLSGAPGDESHAGRGRSLRTPAAADLGRWPTSRPLSLSRSPALPRRAANREAPLRDYDIAWNETCELASILVRSETVAMAANLMSSLLLEKTDTKCGLPDERAEKRGTFLLY